MFRKIIYCLTKAKLEKGKNDYENLSLDSLKVRLEIEGENNQIKIGEKVKGKLKIIVKGSNHLIEIEDQVRFNGDSIIRAESNNTKIVIGYNTATMGSRFVCLEPKTQIIVGKNCLFGSDTKFWCTDFHSIVDAETQTRINYPEKIVIHDHVWISYGVAVLKNTVVSQDSIIGCQSVVTRDIPQNVIAMGVPCKIMKEGVNWDKNRLP